MEYYLVVKMKELQLNSLTLMNIAGIEKQNTEISEEYINRSSFTYNLKYKKLKYMFYKDTDIDGSYREFHDNDTLPVQDSGYL